MPTDALSRHGNRTAVVMADSSERLTFHDRDNLAHFKCPRSVDFVEELPRTPTGKLLKRTLRDRYVDA